MNSFITKIFSDNIIENYIIDLTGAEYLDSTNLGMLARIQSLSRKKSGKIPVLVSSEATVNSILQIHGFDNLFTITATANLPGQATTEVLPEKQDGLGVESVLLAAHQELAATSEKNAAVYNNVIKLMKKDT
jgi:anti-anti-sigma factor